jgi:hypothetical protein
MSRRMMGLAALATAPDRYGLDRAARLWRKLAQKLTG